MLMILFLSNSLINPHLNNIMFCEFDFLGNGYRCKNCGIFIATQDGMPPVFPCKKNTIREKGESEISFLEKIKNFANAASEHISSGMKLASDKTLLDRYNICEDCEFFKNGSCSQCGCPVYRHKKFISKLSWAEQRCPVGKWGPETI